MSQSWVPPPVAASEIRRPGTDESAVLTGSLKAWALQESCRRADLPAESNLSRSTSFVPDVGDLLAEPASRPAHAAPSGEVPGSISGAQPATQPPLAAPTQSGTPTLGFVSASYSRQHPAKIRTGIVNADVVEEGLGHLGLCDGVSGCHHMGIPPHELPRELLRCCRSQLLRSADAAPEPGADEKEWITSVIRAAYDETRAQGATTLVLAALRNSRLVSACLGDSAMLVLRAGRVTGRLRVVFKSEPGRYDSRRPVQVQRLPGFGDEHAHGVIRGAVVDSTPVQSGDLVVLGSDGIFDNLSDDDIKNTVERHCMPWHPDAAQPPDRVQLQSAAAALVDLAICRVRLGGCAPQQPWGSQSEVPANNADDTTALVAAVGGTTCKRIHYEIGTLESCGVVTSSDSAVLLGGLRASNEVQRRPTLRRSFSAGPSLSTFSSERGPVRHPELHGEECVIS